MRIDIDIRISSDDGEDTLYTKHFSGKLNQNNASIEESGHSNRRFCDFMYEYLTARGKRLREELSGGIKKAVSIKPSVNDLIKDLEYTITLGTGQLLTGKVSLESLDAATEKAGSEDPYFRPAVEYNRLRNMNQVEELVQSFMLQAINRYESNLYHDIKGYTYFIEKS